MTTRVVLLEEHLAELRSHLFSRPGAEGAAFILAGQCCSVSAKKLIAHAIVPIADEDYLRREAYGLTISSRALARISKLARHEQMSVVFAHSHPGGMPQFSEQDDREEAELIPFLRARIPDRIHGTLVLTEDSIAGRLFDPSRVDVDAVIVVGDRIQLWRTEAHNVSAMFDRQVRAFGADVQRLLSSLHVGVVGVGGTGSAVAEQLCRLGIGRLSLFDGDDLEASNVNRVYGSRLGDAGTSKVAIAKRSLDEIGVGCDVNVIPQHITFESAAKLMRDCDVLFGCTDRQLPRAILNQLALRYLIPVFDLGVLIDSEGGRIRGVHGRVTTVLPGDACLFCRGRISSEVIRVEALSHEDRALQIRDGYAPELAEPAPAVIAFTSGVASAAVAEFLHRLTGFMGIDRRSSEVLISFDENRIRTNRVEPRDACMCTDQSGWGVGDQEPFLGLVWPTRTT